MSKTTLIERLRRSLARDQDLPIAMKIDKAARYGAALITAPLHLRDLDAVGARARTRGRPVIENLGRIRVGDDFQINCAFVPVELRTSAGAEIVMGHHVEMNFGVSLSAAERITLGDRVEIGPYTIVIDHDEEGTAPVELEDDVWLATRVRVCKGVRIGAGTVVTAGSTVTSDLPPGVIAGGNPARPLKPRPGFKQAPEAAPVSKKTPAAKPPEHVGVLVADFTIVELAAHLREPDALGPALDAIAAPFDQVVQTLHGLGPLAGEHGASFAVVWTRPERVSASFAERLRGATVSDEAILAEVDAFAAMLGEAAAAVRFVIVPTWTLPPHRRGLGMLDLRPGGLSATLARMNLRLSDALAKASNVAILDAARWVGAAGRDAYSAKLWYMGKVGWSQEVLDLASKDIRAALRGFLGGAKKLLVLDLDDTMWGGIVGDVGWQGLRLGGHDPVGEAFVDFQREVLALSRRGVALAVVSKNEESTALEAMTHHPEMVIKPEMLACHRINWRDKAQNIVEIVKELNLGLQSVVFLDDNPVERARVREALPEVFVPEWPADKMQYAKAFLELDCFDVPRISSEDLERNRMYAEERQRTELKTKLGSLDEWLMSLGTRVRFVRLDASNLPRTCQLMNKTNQLNLRTRRLAEPELLAWAGEPGHEVWAVYVSDKLGDAGLTGVLSLARRDGAMEVVDYVLSCRVMGRRVEETLAWFAVERARRAGLATVRAPFFTTAKNKPTRTFWDGSGFAHVADGDVYVWDKGDYGKPPSVAVEEVGS